ncbi:MAG: RNA polymerase sigma factor [Lachnospiraceae bacterium]
MNLDEEVLVRRMKEGDKASFDLLYDKYKNVALRTAYLITGNLPDSEDVVQDTFVKVYLHCKEIKNDSGFKAWMMQILVRTAYKAGKKKGRELPDEEVIDKADTRTERSSLEQVMVKEESRMLSEAIRRLPMKQRTVIILFYYQEYSVSEIAHMLSLREGTIKSRLHVARERLRGMLEKDSDTAAYMHSRILE